VRDGGLRDVTSAESESESESGGRGEQLACSGDPGPIPARAVLIREQHHLSVGVESALATGVVRQHQRKQAEHLWFVRHQLGQHLAKVEGSRAQLDPNMGITGAGGVPLVEHEVDGGQPVGQVSRGRHGAIEHAELTYSDGVVMLGSKSGADSPYDTHRVCTYLVTKTPDALHDQAVAAGAEIVQQLTDQYYGSREFAARDPEGNVWAFGTYRPAAVS